MRIKEKKEEVFDELINNLKTSIKVWEYFVKWEKVNVNINNFKIEFNMLNSLTGSEDLEHEFISLVRKYPNVVEVLPIILAVREKRLEILKDYKSQDLNYISFDFNQTEHITEEDAKKYFIYLKESGLIELFNNKKVKNFVDYALGVEIGLDSNGRKNRGGTIMEEIVEIFIKNIVHTNEDLDYMRQATSNKI